MQHIKASVCGLKSFCSAAAEDDAAAKATDDADDASPDEPVEPEKSDDEVRDEINGQQRIF